MRSFTARRASLAAFFVSAALFVGVGALAINRIVSLGATNAAVEHTLLVRAEAEMLMSLLKDAETGQRGYIITGQQMYMQPYTEAIAALPKRIENFRRMTADNPVQQRNISAFEGLAARRASILREGILARQEYGFESAAQVVGSGEGKRLMDYGGFELGGGVFVGHAADCRRGSGASRRLAGGRPGSGWRGA